MSKLIDLCLSGVFFQAVKYAKTRFLPDSAGGAYDASPDPQSLFPPPFGISIWPLTSLKFVHLARR